MFEAKKFEKFEFWKFGFVSHFDIRISDFFNHKGLIRPATPGYANRSSRASSGLGKGDSIA
jgi:hypothetical protein